MKGHNASRESRDSHKARLLHGPYEPPTLRRGDRATCLYRDGDVVITGWSAGRIAWPRCRRLDSNAGGSDLLVNEELARAVRLESSLALQYWFGVGADVVWRWRKALGVTQWGTEGSRRLLQQISRAGAEAVKRKTFTKAERSRHRVAALKRGTRPHRWTDNGWSSEQLALLGRLPDTEVAAQIGRTTTGVRVKRQLLGIPNAAPDRRRREYRKMRG
jgi:hypothetical protein